MFNQLNQYLSMQTPRDLGFQMPAEWHEHSATLFAWPHNRSTWPNERLDRVEAVYQTLIITLSRYEPVLVVAANKNVYQRVNTFLAQSDANSSNISVIIFPNNDNWVRDSGPIMIKKNSEFAVTDWLYNAWGEKYSPWDSDNKLPFHIANKFNLRRFKVDMVLEGGSIETNGDGLFLTTESVLLNPNRNPHLTKEEIEGYLKNYLGAEKIIWLKNGLEGDDTDGHVDDLSRFVDKSTVVTCFTDDKSDVNYQSLKENYEILKNSTDAEGNRLEIIKLPMPKTKIDGTTFDGSEYVPASYANFYIGNDVILLPVYDEKYDQKVIEMFKKLFTDRTVEAIPCADLVWGQGSIHCITQQLYGIDSFSNKSFN